MRRPKRQTLVEHLLRLTAGGLAGLVVALGFLAVSPEAHNWLHAHSQAGHFHDGAHSGGGCKSHAPTPNTEEGCVVELFAQGIETGAGAIEWVVCLSAWAEIAFLPHRELMLCSPRYLRQPERGPPAGAA